MIHIPGVKHRAADCASRHPSGELNPNRLHLTYDVCGVSTDNLTFPTFSETIGHFVAGNRQDISGTLTESVDILVASAFDTPPAITWDRVRLATTTDPDMHYLTTIIPDKEKWQKDHLPHQIQAYYAFRHHLSTTDGAVLYKYRIVLPPSLRPDYLKALHAAPQSTSLLIARAELSIFWPGVMNAIASTRDNCSHCNHTVPPQPKATPMPPILAVYPFQRVCADYFYNKGINYLVIVDRYFNWPIVERAQDGSYGLINCSAAALLLLVSLMNYPPMVALNSPQQPHANSLKPGVSTTECHLLLFPTATVMLRLESRQSKE